jgi:diphthamide synthase (EF-2-diphthine--ammonia ligase)
MQYMQTEGDEVEDLFCLLAYVKECIPGVTAVCSGAIASDYQRLRVRQHTGLPDCAQACRCSPLAN